VCENQIVVKMDIVDSRTDWGPRILQRLYVRSVNITSTLTATLGHQTKQVRLKVSGRNADAHHVCRVCTIPVPKRSRVCVVHNHLNHSQRLPHHRL